MALVDLHLHTTASDGRLTPTQLVELATERGLKHIAITDHDSTQGLAEAFLAAKRYPQLQIIPGIELSTDVPSGEIHLLGYYLNYRDQSFQRNLERMRDARVGRAKSMVEKLAALGLPLKWERIVEIAGDGSFGRPHIAKAMVEAGHVSSVREAFDLYIGRNGPAYAEREKLTPEAAVEMLVKVGGLPVIAHPREVENLEEVLPRLKAVGLVGMEVHYGSYTQDQVNRLRQLADLNGLIPCGGSDYHAIGYPDEAQPGTVGPPVKSWERLAALARQRGLASRLG